MKIPGAIVRGQSIAGPSEFDVINPATGEVISRVAGSSVAIGESAVAAAKAAFPGWAACGSEQRGKLLSACADLLEANAEKLAELLTTEQGKPLGALGSRFEIGGAIGWTRATAALDLPVEQINTPNMPTAAVHRRPLGVVASITPWNWPVMIAIWHVMPALLAGNTVVIKPSPLTPLSTLAAVEMLQQILPPGVLNAVVGDEAIGPMLTSHPDVAKVTFTGSTATGRRVMTSAAPTLKRLTLELGGNDAGIVLPDCDPGAIAEGLFWGAFINNGQTCAALKRLYVHSSIHDAVVDALVAFAEGIKVGNGLLEDSVLGPIQNSAQFSKVAALVDDAASNGARIATGGKPLDGPGLFYMPTIVTGCSAGLALVEEEQFGPALPVIRYDDVEDAIAQANALDVGLGGSIWSQDIERARTLAGRLECGSAWLNGHGAVRPDVPFGGVKSSGFGVEFGQHGLDEFVSLQAIHG